MRISKTILAAAALMLGTLQAPAAGQAAHRKNTKDNHIKKEKKMTTVQLTTQEFKDKVWNYDTHQKEFKYEGKLPAIVDFHATWCGPCKALGPVLEDLAKEYAGKIIIYKVDVDQAEEVAAVFGIRSVPTLLFVPAGGEKPSMQPGAPSRAQLKAVIEEMIK